jgi:hypothetical protein
MHEKEGDSGYGKEEEALQKPCTQQRITDYKSNFGVDN